MSNDTDRDETCTLCTGDKRIWTTEDKWEPCPVCAPQPEQPAPKADEGRGGEGDANE